MGVTAMQLETLQAILEGVQGVTFASLDTITQCKLTGGKANPFQGKVEKHCNGSRVMLFTNKNSSGYENKVRRHLEQAGLDPDSFQMGALPWGERLPNSPIIKNTSKKTGETSYYLQCVFIEAGQSEYYATDLIDCEDGTWFGEGERILANRIPGLPDKTGSEHQGLERSKQVIVRSYALESIVGLRAMGAEYVKAA
jgi:hypothetical protein